MGRTLTVRRCFFSSHLHQLVRSRSTCGAWPRHGNSCRRTAAIRGMTGSAAARCEPRPVNPWHPDVRRSDTPIRAKWNLRRPADFTNRGLPTARDEVCPDHDQAKPRKVRFGACYPRLGHHPKSEPVNANNGCRLVLSILRTTPTKRGEGAVQEPPDESARGSIEESCEKRTRAFVGRAGRVGFATEPDRRETYRWSGRAARGSAAFPGSPRGSAGVISPGCRTLPRFPRTPVSMDGTSTNPLRRSDSLYPHRSTAIHEVADRCSPGSTRAERSTEKNPWAPTTGSPHPSAATRRDPPAIKPGGRKASHRSHDCRSHRSSLPALPVL